MSLAIRPRFAAQLEPADIIGPVLFRTAYVIRRSQDRINRTGRAMQNFDAALLKIRHGVVDAWQLLERTPTA